MTRPLLLSVLVLPVLAVAGLGCGGQRTGTAGVSAASRAEPCRPAVSRGVLPPWTRTGFSDPRPRLPHALGRHGRIAALLFADPLRSPPALDHANKILWVPRVTPSAPTNLHIRAQRMLGDRPEGAPVARTVTGGPGPSYVDLPAPGCWRLSLRWARTSDRVDLRYRAG
jgi:hypothetical protein